MISSVYECSTYREVLRFGLLRQRQRHGLRFTFERMAEACRVQKSYLSRSLSGKAQLNADQVFLACQYLGFDKDEKNYTLTLEAYERSTIPERQDELMSEAMQIKQSHQTTEANLPPSVRTEIPENWMSLYFTPYAELVHMALTIPKYRKNPKALEALFPISSKALQDIIETLERIGLILNTAEGMTVSAMDTHLKKDSSFFRTQSFIRHMHALEAQSQQRDPNGYQFSALFTADEETRQAIQKILLDGVEKAHAYVQRADDKEVYQLNIGLFSWTTGR